VLLGHSPVVGRVPVPRRGYNYQHGSRRGPLPSGPSGTRRGPMPSGPSGTRRGPLFSGQNVYQGRLNSQRVVSQLRKDRLRAGNSIKTNNLTNPNNHRQRLSGTGSRRHQFDDERRQKIKGIRHSKRQHGSKPNNRVHPLDSYRRRKRKKQFQDQIRNEQHNKHKDDTTDDSTSIRDDYDDTSSFQPSPHLETQSLGVPSSPYHSDNNKKYAQQNIEPMQQQDQYRNKHTDNLSKPYNNFEIDMDRFLDGPQDGQGFFHGIPENFPSLSDLVGEFSEKKEEKLTGEKLTHMVNYQRNDDGTITAKLEEGRQPY